MTGGVNSRAMIGLILIGFLSFFAVLYLLATGAGDNAENRAGNHAASAGLDGFRALRKLADAQNYDVRLIRGRADLNNPDLTILTPPFAADPDEIESILRQRRMAGPTILILPKWLAMSAGDNPGWINPVGSRIPDWVENVETLAGIRLVQEKSPAAGWSGLGYSGDFPNDQAVTTMRGSEYLPLVRDSEGRMVAGVLNDGSAPLALVDESGAPDATYRDERRAWPLLVIADPDLVDNWGLADPAEARLAMALIDIVNDENNARAVRFDLTLNGLGAETNLLTLAFQPPFIAATLCLLLAAIALAWRSLARFGPSLQEERAIAFGKTQLVANSAALVERSRRFYLLGAPYAALVRRKIATRLAVASRADAVETERQIDLRLTRRGLGENAFSGPASDLRRAEKPNEILRAARTLRDIERTVQ